MNEIDPYRPFLTPQECSDIQACGVYPGEILSLKKQLSEIVMRNANLDRELNELRFDAAVGLRIGDDAIARNWNKQTITNGIKKLYGKLGNARCKRIYIAAAITIKAARAEA